MRVGYTGAPKIRIALGTPLPPVGGFSRDLALGRRSPPVRGVFETPVLDRQSPQSVFKRSLQSAVSPLWEVNILTSHRGAMGG